jgi:transposase
MRLFDRARRQARPRRSAEPAPSRGSVSPLEKHAQGIFTLIAEQPDLTLDEMVRVLRKRRIPASRSTLSRFFARHNITAKKAS